MTTRAGWSWAERWPAWRSDSCGRDRDAESRVFRDGRLRMRKRRGFLVGVAFSAGVILGWIAARASGQGEPEPRMAARPTTSSWIRGEGDQRFGQIENHFRGLDVAMAEIGYRYTELFFAVQDRNWEYADYQLGKIEVVLKLAIERRPKRAPSATAFLTQDWPGRPALAQARHGGAGPRAASNGMYEVSRLRAGPVLHAANARSSPGADRHGAGVIPRAPRRRSTVRSCALLDR